MLRILLAAGAALSFAGAAIAQTPADYPPCKKKTDDHCTVMGSGKMAHGKKGHASHMAGDHMKGMHHDMMQKPKAEPKPGEKPPAN